MIGHWDSLRREVVTAPRLTEFQKSFDHALRHMVRLLGMMLCMGVGLDDPCGSLPVQHILWFCKDGVGEKLSPIEFSERRSQQQCLGVPAAASKKT